MSREATHVLTRAIAFDMYPGSCDQPQAALPCRENAYKSLNGPMERAGAKGGARGGVASGVVEGYLPKNVSKLRAGHAGIVWPCVGLELFSTGQVADDHWVESRIQHQACGGFHGLGIIAGQRNTDPVSHPMRLPRKRFEVNSVECLYLSRLWEQCGRPSGRALRMLGGLACRLPVALLVGISGVEYDFGWEQRCKITREIRN
jgi:hypothetical protein